MTFSLRLVLHDIYSGLGLVVFGMLLHIATGTDFYQSYDPTPRLNVLTVSVQNLSTVHDKPGSLKLLHYSIHVWLDL